MHRLYAYSLPIGTIRTLNNLKRSSLTDLLDSTKRIKINELMPTSNTTNIENNEYLRLVLMSLKEMGFESLF